MELVAEYRDMLLRCFVYTNTKKSELERALFRKALFILNNGMETCVQNKRQALLILAADQDLLFKEHDSVYLDRCINGPVYVHNNDVVRKQYTKQGKDALIRLSLLRGFQHQQTEGVSDKKKVANDILKRLLRFPAVKAYTDGCSRGLVLESQSKTSPFTKRYTHFSLMDINVTMFFQMTSGKESSL